MIPIDEQPDGESNHGHSETLRLQPLLRPVSATMTRLLMVATDHRDTTDRPI